MSIHDHAPIITVPTVHEDGALALYTGALTDKVHLDLGNTIVTTSDTDLAPLAKAILNAMEPEALVENQKDAEPEQQYDVPALIAAVASLEDRVADLEAVAKDDEIKVGDLVRYTKSGTLPGAVRKVTDIYGTGASARYRLVHVSGYMRGEQAHSGARRDQIEKEH